MVTAAAYDWSHFSLKIEIAASPERVFRAWTTAEELSSWFTIRTEFEPKKGGRVFFEWLGGDHFETTVTELKKNKLVVFPFGSGGEEVRVKIRKSRVGSIITLEQLHMKTSPKHKVGMHLGCKVGWTFFLANLKAWLEHGVDLRSHDRQKSYANGYINS